MRGRLDEATSERLVEFWTAQGALTEAAARERLGQVACVLHDDEGEVAGVNSVYAATAPLLNRRFWIYRRFLRPGVDLQEDLAMIAATFEALANDFGGGSGDPVGLCALISQRELLEAHPEAIWPEVDLTFAGYTDDGAQVRIRYFEGAMI